MAGRSTFSTGRQLPYIRNCPRDRKDARLALMPLVSVSSPDGVEATAARLLASMERRGLEIFARIDHGAGARAAGMDIGEELLLLFGDPRVGTLLMETERTVGYELPLRLLVWESQEGTRVGYRPARALEDEYGLAGRAEILEHMDGLFSQLLAEAVAAG